MNNHNIDQSSKDTTMKVLAILGSLVLIALLVWLAVVIVRILPNAFSSLAGVAEEVYRDDRPADTLTVTPDTDSIDSGDAIVLSWNNLNREGTYRFRYTCEEGVAASVSINGDSTKEQVACDEIFSFDAPARTLAIYVDSEKFRTASFSYALTFSEDDSSETFGEYLGRATVTNDAIRLADDSTEEESDDVSNGEKPERPSTPAPTTPRGPQTRIVYVPYIPSSLPNGYTDLAVRIVAIGEMNGRNFVARPTIDSDARGAVQIEVKNIGTKTSERWDLAFTLPQGGKHELENEEGLKPNESQIVTIAFDPGDDTGTERISAAVSVDNDKDTSNNRVTGSVRIVN